MNLPIAIFYHVKFTGEGIPDENHALSVVVEQVNALERSGLLAKASEFHVGLNGTDSDGLLVAEFLGAKAQLHVHGNAVRTEIPTLAVLRAWLKPKWLVFYHHTKGVTHGNSPLYENWRHCMERVCVWNWEECVRMLEQGFDSAGAHWLTPEKFGPAVRTPFWGGTFWWARSDFLMSLPALPAPAWENRYKAESWIGEGPRRPRVHDFAPHWPELNACR